MKRKTNIRRAVILTLAVSLAGSLAEAKSKSGKTTRKEVVANNSKQNAMKNKLEIKSFQKETQYTTVKQIVFGGKQVAEIRGEANVQFVNDTLVMVRKSGKLYNGKRTPENPMEHCVAKASEVMDNLDLSLTKTGEIAAVKNRDFVLQKWSHCKIFLERYFVSDEPNVKRQINSLIAAFERNVEDEEAFLLAVKNDLFYSTFFRGFYRDYGAAAHFTQKGIWPITPLSERAVIDEEWSLTESDGIRNLLIKKELNRSESPRLETTFDLEASGSASFDEQGVPLVIKFNQKESNGSDLSKETIVTIKLKN